MKKFNRGGGFKKGGRDAGRPEMHRATCADCGQSCEVPFRPSGDKPVYCSNCFKNHGGSDRKNNTRDFDRRSNFDDKKMFKATCTECGQSCEVPFKPTSGKPIYCSACFGHGDQSKNKSDRKNNDLAELNTKLDKIITTLELLVANKPKTEKNTIKEVKKSKPILAKKEVKKITKKTVVTKKKK